MNDIFISYARDDLSKVKALKNALQSRGWSVWWDRDIPLGSPYRETIHRELKKARCVVVVWSNRSVSSDWVQDEAQEGKDKGILIPVAIENVSPPLGFRGLQAAELFRWDGSPSSPYFTKLVTNIESVLTKKEEERPILPDSFALCAEGIPKIAHRSIQRFQEDGENVKQVAFGPSSGWVILRGRKAFWLYDIPTKLQEKLWDYYHAGEEIRQVAFTPGAGWVVLVGKNGYWCSGVPKEMSDKLSEFNDAGQLIRSVAFAPNSGWVILVDKNGFCYNGVPKDMSDKLYEFYNADQLIKSVAFSPDSGWVILVNRNGFWQSGIPKRMADRLWEFYNADQVIKNVAFTGDSGWLVLGVTAAHQRV